MILCVQPIGMMRVSAEDETPYAGIMTSGEKPAPKLTNVPELVEFYNKQNKKPGTGLLTEAKVRELLSHSLDTYRIYKTDRDKFYDPMRLLFEWIGAFANKNTTGNVNDAYLDKGIPMLDKKASDGIKDQMNELVKNLEAAKEKAPEENKERVQAAIDKLKEFAGTSGSLDFKNEDIDKTVSAANELIADPASKPDVPGYDPVDADAAAAGEAKKAADQFKIDNSHLFAQEHLINISSCEI